MLIVLLFVQLVAAEPSKTAKPSKTAEPNKTAEPLATFDFLGYSPELNVAFAQSFKMPDDQKCTGYILDFDKHIKFAMGPVVDVAPALVAAGEDEEGASCQLRDFAGQLELTLRTEKTFNETERKLLAPFLKADWKGKLEGFKNGNVNSLGLFLRVHRPKWNPELSQKVFALGTTEAEDKNWVDAFAALLIANPWKPGFATKESRERSRLISETSEKATLDPAVMNDKKERAKLLLSEVVATRLDPKNARPWLNLAKLPELGFARRALLVSRALGLDPVMATKAYRESDALKDLRCDPKATGARKVLPAEMVGDPRCS